MTLGQGEEVGEEVYEIRDQFFRLEAGAGEVWIDGNRSRVEDDDAIVVPAGTRHNVVHRRERRRSPRYAPPEHRDGTAHVTKAEAEALGEHLDGATTE
jgi:mannose-6-phosphate isomerase-like protein (cupin superfamily)